MGIGFRNTKISQARIKNTEIMQSDSSNEVVKTQEVLSGSESIKSAESEVKKIVIIKITDGEESVNIRERPTTKSEILTKAYDGDSFEFITKEEDWYQIKLEESSTAFVSDKYAFLEGENE
jgi:uncharacterized protein YgiM (DUF1202 family)